jgi:hypothetical protein
VATSLPWYVVVGATFARGGQLTASWTDQIRWLDQSPLGGWTSDARTARDAGTWPFRYTMSMNKYILICYNHSLKSSYSILL